MKSPVLAAVRVPWVGTVRKGLRLPTTVQFTVYETRLFEARTIPRAGRAHKAA